MRMEFFKKIRDKIGLTNYSISKKLRTDYNINITTQGLDLYDKAASIEFGWFLRPTLKFDGLDELLVQMKKDCDEARRLTEQ